MAMIIRPNREIDRIRSNGCTQKEGTALELAGYWQYGLSQPELLDFWWLVSGFGTDMQPTTKFWMARGTSSWMLFDHPVRRKSLASRVKNNRIPLVIPTGPPLSHRTQCLPSAGDSARIGPPCSAFLSIGRRR